MLRSTAAQLVRSNYLFELVRQLLVVDATRACHCNPSNQRSMFRKQKRQRANQFCS
jgi:hypothetical protein